jgi:hypothetical protein
VAGLVAVAALGAGGYELAASRHAATTAPPPVPRIAPATGRTLAGAPLQRARCTDWRASGSSQRLAAVQGLTMMIGGPTPAGPATVLTDAEAFRLFDDACATRVARHFALFELYVRAAGFHSYLPR